MSGYPVLNLTPETRQSLQEQRAKLAGADVSSAEPEVRDVVRKAIDLSFVDAFRRVMFFGAGLAFASAITAWALIDAKRTARSRS
ncbi:MAG: hypothetical protein V7609_546 [Verrucomicrobiota bacterium]